MSVGTGMSTAGECQGRSSVLEQLCVQFPLITELLLQKQEEIRLRVTVVSWEKKSKLWGKKRDSFGKNGFIFGGPDVLVQTAAFSISYLVRADAQETFIFYFQVSRAGLCVPAELSEAFFECREIPVGNSSNTAFIFIFLTEKDQTLKTVVIAFE